MSLRGCWLGAGGPKRRYPHERIFLLSKLRKLVPFCLAPNASAFVRHLSPGAVLHARPGSEMAGEARLCCRRTLSEEEHRMNHLLWVVAVALTVTVLEIGIVIALECVRTVDEQM